MEPVVDRGVERREFVGQFICGVGIGEVGYVDVEFGVVPFGERV